MFRWKISSPAQEIPRSRCTGLSSVKFRLQNLIDQGVLSKQISGFGGIHLVELAQSRIQC
jgi:hypothetical protein